MQLEIYNKLRDYQKEGVDFILTHPNAGIFDQQRLGKTPTALASLNFMRFKQPVLIIAPKSTLRNWEEECKKWYPNRTTCVINPDKLGKQKRIELYLKNFDVYFINYTTIYNDEIFLPEFDCVIIDEAHRLHNFKGSRSKHSPKFTKAIMNIVNYTKYKILLTGTPCPNYAWDIYPLLHILDRDQFRSYYNFVDEYFNHQIIYTATGDTVEKPTTFKRGKEEELIKIIKKYSIQRKRKDYMQWIPKIDKEIVEIPLDKKNTLWYNELVETFEIKELNISCPNKLTLIMEARQLTSRFKLGYVKDYLDDYQDEQTIVISEFSSILKELYEEIKDKYKVKLLIGETPVDKRKEIQDDFNNKKINIILANIQVAKEGMKLEQGNTILVLDPSLTYTDNEQMYDRIIPTSKEVALEKDKQKIIKIICSETVDDYIFKMLSNKKSSTEIINNFNKR